MVVDPPLLVEDNTTRKLLYSSCIVLQWRIAYTACTTPLRGCSKWLIAKLVAQKMRRLFEFKC